MHTVHVILMASCHNNKIRLLVIIHSLKRLPKRFTDHFICACFPCLVAENRPIINNRHLKANHFRKPKQRNGYMPGSADHHLLAAAHLLHKNKMIIGCRPDGHISLKIIRIRHIIQNHLFSLLSSFICCIRQIQTNRVLSLYQDFHSKQFSINNSCLITALISQNACLQLLIVLSSGIKLHNFIQYLLFHFNPLYRFKKSEVIIPVFRRSLRILYVRFSSYQLVAISNCVGFDAAKLPVSQTRHVPRELATVVPLGK